MDPISLKDLQIDLAGVQCTVHLISPSAGARLKRCNDSIINGCILLNHKICLFDLPVFINIEQRARNFSEGLRSVPVTLVTRTRHCLSRLSSSISWQCLKSCYTHNTASCGGLFQKASGTASMLD